jgi:hypothetical protein
MTSPRISAAHAKIESARKLLEHSAPEDLERAAVLLEAAAADTAEGRKGLSSPDDPRWHQLAAVRQASLQCRALLEKVASYHAGWRALIGARLYGYEPGGSAAPIVSAGRLSVQG